MQWLLGFVSHGFVHRGQGIKTKINFLPVLLNPSYKKGMNRSGPQPTLMTALCHLEQHISHATPFPAPLFLFTTHVTMPLSVCLSFLSFYLPSSAPSPWQNCRVAQALFPLCHLPFTEGHFFDTSGTGFYRWGGRSILSVGGPLPKLSPQPRHAGLLSAEPW